MQPVAAKYGFEIGVNWCNSSASFCLPTGSPACTPKSTPARPRRALRPLLPVSGGQRAVGPDGPDRRRTTGSYLFGPGAQPAEYAYAASKVRLPEGMPQSAVLRRWAEWGTLEENRYVPVRWSPEIQSWKELGMISPRRGRGPRAPDGRRAPPLGPLRRTGRPHRVYEAVPRLGVDERRSGLHRQVGIRHAGHGQPRLRRLGRTASTIRRDGGRTYERMWEFSMASRDSLDMMFIASSTTPRGTRSNPPVENGDRELRTTLHYAAQFKEMPEDASGIALPPGSSACANETNTSPRHAARRPMPTPCWTRPPPRSPKVVIRRPPNGSPRPKRPSMRSKRRSKTARWMFRNRNCASAATPCTRRPVRLARAESLPARNGRPGRWSAARAHTGYLEFEYFDDAPTERLRLPLLAHRRPTPRTFSPPSPSSRPTARAHGNGCGSNWPNIFPRRRALR